MESSSLILRAIALGKNAFYFALFITAGDIARFNWTNRNQLEN